MVIYESLREGVFMRYEDFYRQAKKREQRDTKKDDAIAENFIDEYLGTAPKSFLLWAFQPHIEYLINEYFEVKGTKAEEYFIKLLNSYNFDYSMSIHNAIYYLLATEKEKNSSVNPASWPGVYEIKSENPKYTLKTILGTIEVYKASEILKDFPSIHIFSKPLMGQCYERTYDFLKENNDYKAVLSYMPNFFYGGHYHAYLERDDTTLDIASNALYTDHSSANKILCGDIIAKLTYKQAKQKFKTIKNTIPNIKQNQKLLTLALYYDQKRERKS